MTNPLKALRWRMYGSYDPQGPVTEDSPDRAQNRARYEVWKYNTFGPGRDVYGKDYAYRIVDSGDLSRKPLYINDPWDIAAMALIIAEMEGHKEIALREPRVMPTDKPTALEKIAREEERAINRVVNWFDYRRTYNDVKGMLDTLKRHNNPA